MDWHYICREFNCGRDIGSLELIRGGHSDPHNGGRTVLELQFTTGLRIGYKPKSVAIDLAWTSFLRWLDSNGAPKCCGVVRTIDRGEYGWVEWIDEQKDYVLNEIDEFYKRAGSTLCLFVALGGVDFHADNVIALEGVPYPVDLETLLHPWQPLLSTAASGETALALAAVRLKRSVVATFYLPSWMLRTDEELIRTGGLNEAPTLVDERTSFLDVNTDSMRPGGTAPAKTASRNLPPAGNAHYPPDNKADQVKAGFELMYRFLIEYRELLCGSCSPLRVFEGVTVRVIHRPTRLYALLLDRALRGHAFSNGFQWSLQFEHLARSTRNASSSRHTDWAILAAERKALARLDVPYATTRTNSNDLHFQNYLAITDYFPMTSLERQRLGITEFSEAELERQLEFIDFAFCSTKEHGSLYCPNPVSALDQTKTLTRHEAIEICREFAVGLFQQAVFHNDEAAWIGAVPIPSVRHVAQLEVTGHSLYAGGTGIGLFLSALFSATGDEQYRVLALAAFRCLRSEMRNNQRFAASISIGGGIGLGSIIYALARSAHMIGDFSLVEDALTLSEQLSPSQIERDVRYDLIFGASGAILGLLALYKMTRANWILERAISCGKHLLEKRRVAPTGGSAWETFNGVLLTGMSHGAAGIALALERLFRESGDRAFHLAALSAIEYERSLFSASEDNWPDLRWRSKTGRHVYVTQWCHGASGIGLARLEFLGAQNEEAILGDVRAALRTTLAAPYAPNDDVCCGNFGRIEFLPQAGQKLSRPDLIGHARSMSHLIYARAAKNADFSWKVGSRKLNPGFHAGLSGVGYELLRVTAPDSLPSVLLWE